MLENGIDDREANIRRSENQERNHPVEQCIVTDDLRAGNDPVKGNTTEDNWVGSGRRRGKTKPLADHMEDLKLFREIKA